MKVTQGEKPFTPVTLTFETKCELDTATELFGNVVGTGAVREFVDDVYEALERAGGNASAYVFSSAARISDKTEE